MTPRLSGFAVSSSSTDTMLVERLGAYESSNGPASSDREASIARSDEDPGELTPDVDTSLASPTSHWGGSPD